MNPNKGKDKSSKPSRLFSKQLDQIYDEQEKKIITTSRVQVKNTAIASFSHNNHNHK
jgi:hypothetical protein